jgi:hypothetical protein
MFWINVRGMKVTDDLNYILHSNSLCASILWQRRQLGGKAAGQQEIALHFCGEREKVQNATQLAGYLRCDGVGHRPVPAENRKRYMLCIKAPMRKDSY